MTKNMTLEQSLAVLATKELTEEDKNLILMENGLITVEKGKAVATNASTFSLSAYTAGIKANTKAWLANMVANPKTWIVAIGVAIYGIVKAIDYYNGALQRQKEKLEEVKQSFEEAQSDMESANQELETTRNRIEELQSMGSLSFVEAAELERLKETVEELSIAADIAERIAQHEAENLSEENEKTYNQEYGKYNYNNNSKGVQDIYTNAQNLGTDGARYISEQMDDGNLSANLASLLYAKEQLEQAKTDYNNAVLNGNIELADELKLIVKDAETQVEDIELMLASSLSTLEGYKKNAESAGDTESDYYKSIISDMKLIYEYLDPAKWNTVQVEKIFNTKDIELTKDQLIEMAESGELKPETISQYKNLNKALSESNLILKEDEESVQKFVEQIYSMIDSIENVNPDEIGVFTPTISPSVQQIAKQLEPQFAKLGEAYQNIFTADGFTLENVDNSMLEELRTTFAEIEEEIGVTFDATQLNSFFDSLTNGESTAEQVQQSFNDLATAYFYSTDTLEHLNEETAESIQRQLEEMGVLNAQEVVLNNLNNAKVQQKIASIDFSEATAEEIRSLVSYGEQLGLTTQQVYALYLKQLLLNNDPIQTQNSILQLIGLCQAGSETAEILIDLYDIMVAISKGQQKLASGELIGAQAEVTQAEIEKLQKQMSNKINNMLSNTEVEWSNIGGGSDGASKAGSEAGDAYVDAFNKELENLKDLRDQGLITEKEYLDRYRALYEKYFKDIDGYAKEFADNQKQYLDGMLSLYDSALSGISKLMGSKIDAVKEEKDVTISALEEERDARLEVIEAQKEQLEAEIDLIDEQIEAKQEIIDGIQDEINKMREANEERQRQQDLMLAEYNLQKMLNQRTKLVKYMPDAIVI